MRELIVVLIDLDASSSPERQNWACGTEGHFAKVSTAQGSIHDVQRLIPPERHTIGAGIDSL